MRLDNAFLIIARPLGGHSLEKIEEVVTEELNRLKVEPASDKELQKVRNEVSASFVRGLDSNFGLARQLAYYELLTG